MASGLPVISNFTPPQTQLPRMGSLTDRVPSVRIHALRLAERFVANPFDVEQDTVSVGVGYKVIENLTEIDIQ